MDQFLSIDRQASDWRFDPSNFVAQLSKDWPSAKVGVVTNPKHPGSCEWSIRLPQSRGKTLDGFLMRAGHALSLEGTLEDSATFALWVRSIVPTEVPLRFFTDQHPNQMLITRETGASAIIEAFQ
jgi:hypothetical protein